MTEQKTPFFHLYSTEERAQLQMGLTAQWRRRCFISRIPLWGLSVALFQSAVLSPPSCQAQEQGPAEIQTVSATLDSAPLSMPSFVMVNTISDEKQRAISRHEVIFHQGRIFDFSDQSPRFITAYSPATEEIILLDKKTSVRSTLSVDTLVSVTALARAKVTEEGQAEQFGLATEILTSQNGKRFSTSYGNVQYSVLTDQPANHAHSNSYTQFVDLASRLGVATKTDPAPFARMNINEQIGLQQRIPQVTTMTLTQDHESRKFTGTHELIPKLSEQHLQQINEVIGMMTLYREVPLSEFPKES